MEELKVELSRDAAVVLFEWLARFNDSGAAEFADQSEQRVRWDLQAALETQLDEPFAHDYQRLLANARQAVRDLTQ